MESFTLGTGASIYSQKLLPAVLAAKHEVILVTCYWAQSKTLSALCATLEELAKQRQQQQQQQPANVLRVRVCFSSRSFFQKLFHTSSPDGYVYPPATWTTKLGLPSPQTLAAGNIDLKVKSLFFLPFSVMHPKFLIVDRQRAFLPSCNVSWEPWLEGCLELSRRAAHEDPLDHLLEFYRGVWEKDLDLNAPLPQPLEISEQHYSRHIEAMIKSPADVSTKLSNLSVPSDAVEVLPSWHRRNPAFSFRPWKDPVPPQTPLNNALLKLLQEATTEIYIHTPNLTSAPIISAVLDTLARGVDVSIVTGRSMMVWEQVLTAGTTTAWCVKRLKKRYQQLVESDRNRKRPAAPGQQDVVDVEAQNVSPGSLKVQYFKPIAGSTLEEEPVHDHLKLTIVDAKHTVLGSGNMDRASWFTSQELGILIHSATFSAAIRSTVDRVMEGRLEDVFPLS